MAVLSRCIGNEKNVSVAINRHIRSLDFPSGSGMGIFFAVAIPIDVPDKSVSVSFYFEANYAMPTINSYLEDGYFKKRTFDRNLIYQFIQNKLESMGYPGKACLQRAICESTNFPFSQNGLLGDIIRIILTPSSSLKENLHIEIEEAEYVNDCERFCEKCPFSLLDLISQTF